MIQHKTLQIIFALLLISSWHLSYGALPPKEEANEKIDNKQDRINTQAVLDILKKNKVDKTDFSVSVMDLSNEKTVFNYHELKPHIPASVTKVFTAYFALSVLGADTKFDTTLAYTGKIKNNVLEGDLYLIGGGDPYLTNEKLLNLALEMKMQGIYEVNGGFFFDESLFPKLEKISLVGLEDHTYNSSVSALSSDFNRIRIVRGKNKRFETLPKLSFIDIDLTNESLGPGEKFQRDYLVSLDSPKKDAETEDIIVERWFGSKKERYSYVEEIPIREPGHYTASMFDFYAKKLGIKLPIPKPVSAPAKRKIIAQVYSPELIEISKLALYYSNNLLAESLLFHAARRHSKKPIINMIDGSRIMETWLKEKFPRSSFEKLKLQNGSGLSSANTVSAKEMTAFLKLISKDKFEDRYFWTLLPASAHSGFLRKRFQNNDSAFNIWAKTGSLDYVNNIAGFLFSKNGQQFAFSIMFQDLDGRKVVDGPNSKKAEKYRQEAKRWRNRTQDALDEILEYLIINL